MSKETDIRTIFLATDGRHTTLGRGDDVEASPDLIAEVQRQGLRGWVAVLAGSYHGKRRVELERVHALNDAPDEAWEPAVAAFMAIRASAAT